MIADLFKSSNVTDLVRLIDSYSYSADFVLSNIDLDLNRIKYLIEERGATYYFEVISKSIRHKRFDILKYIIEKNNDLEYFYRTDVKDRIIEKKHIHILFAISCLYKLYNGNILSVANKVSYVNIKYNFLIFTTLRIIMSCSYVEGIPIKDIVDNNTKIFIFLDRYTINNKVTNILV